MQIKNVDFWDHNHLDSVDLEMGPGICTFTASSVVLVCVL